MFSPNEQKILEVLGEEKMSISEITKKIYVRPMLNGSTIVGNSINRIVKKCKFHKLNWTLKSQGGGRGGKTVWRVKK